MNATAPLVRLEGLTKIFHGRSRTHALSGIHLDIAQG
jgi:hypothetical protein